MLLFTSKRPAKGCEYLSMKISSLKWPKQSHPNLILHKIGDSKALSPCVDTISNLNTYDRRSLYWNPRPLDLNRHPLFVLATLGYKRTHIPSEYCH